MAAVLRALVAVVAGLLVSFVLVVAVEIFSGVVHPFPEDFGGTTEEICQHVERYPQWVLAVVVMAWAVVGFAGTWTARRIGNLYSSVIVGVLLLAALVLNISMLPYPTWFKISNLIVVPIATTAGSRLAVRHNPPDTAEETVA